MGRPDVVRMWLKKFPNTHFGITAVVQHFDQEQIKGLQEIPRDKLLMETDKPYFPLGGATINTPAYFGEVAAHMSAYLDIHPSTLMKLAVDNAQKLYNYYILTVLRTSYCVKTVAIFINFC
jgi:Tat protein secretion system quality control protein TatD with DNase activity